MEAFLISFAINLAIGILAFKLTKTPGLKPYALSDLVVPTATEDRAQSYGAGVFPVAGNIVYFGNYRYVERRKKIKAFLGLVSKKASIGFEIYLTTWQTLCGITCDELLEVRHGDKVVWSGNLPLSKTDVTTLSVNHRYSEGPGQELPDGLVGTFRFYNQKLNPADNYTAPLPNPQIAALTGIASDDLPGYPNTLHCVFDGMVGITPSLKPITFVVRRMPDVKALLQDGIYLSHPVAGFISGGGAGSVREAAEALIDASSNVNGDANPALVELEVLTTQAAGIGPKLAPTTVGIGAYLRSAERLKTENHGVSFGWNVDRPISELMKDLMAQAYSRRETVSATGQIEMHLVREDDEPVMHFDASNIIKVDSFKRSDPILAPNLVEVPFIDRNADWTERLAIAKNPAAARGAGRAQDIRLEFIGLSQASLAKRIAEREVRKYASPLAKVVFSAAVPPGVLLKPMQRCTFTHPTLNQTLNIRLASVKYGTGTGQLRVDIEALEDIFRAGLGGGVVELAPSSPPSFDPPAPLVGPSLSLAPYALHGDDADHALYVAFDDTTTATGFMLAYQARASWSDEIEPDYAEEVFEPSIRATVAQAVSSRTSGPTLVLDLTPEAAAQWSRETRDLVLMRSGDEWLSASTWSLSGTQLTAMGVSRGLFDTQPAYLAAGAQVELLLGLAIVPDRMKTTPFGLPSYAGMSVVTARAESRSNGGLIAVNDADSSNAKLDWSEPVYRAILPLAPCAVEMGAAYGAQSVQDAVPNVARATSYNVSWKNRNRLARSLNSWFESASDAESGTSVRARIDYEASPGSWSTLGEQTTGVGATSTAVAVSGLPTGPRIIRLRIRSERQGLPSPWHSFFFNVTS